ncbi:MAG: hypothetical protein RLZZ450_1885 [Pseudomonadota bacterium]|jgi:Arc/MetJ family transcription regulator
MNDRHSKDLFVTLDERSYASVKAASRAEVREALDRGRQDLAKAQGQQRAARVDSKIRYR